MEKPTFEESNSVRDLREQIEFLISEHFADLAGLAKNEVQEEENESYLFEKKKLFEGLRSNFLPDEQLSDFEARRRARAFISVVNEAIEIHDKLKRTSGLVWPSPQAIQINKIHHQIIDVLNYFIDGLNKSGKPAKTIFVCYDARKDRELFNLLREEIPVYNFIERDSTELYSHIKSKEIYESIEKADAVIVFIDTNYSKSRWVVHDVGAAREKNKPIIFLGISKNIKKPLESFQFYWIDRIDSKQIKKTIERATYKGNISAHMLSDHAIENSSADLLNFDAYASAIQGIIDNPSTGTPLTIVINAPWGAGKSSLGQLVMKKLQNKPATGSKSPHIPCWFNAWMHDDSENLSSSYLSFLLREVNKYRAWWKRLLKPLPAAILTKREKFFRTGIIWVVLVIFSVVLSILINNELNCINEVGTDNESKTEGWIAYIISSEEAKKGFGAIFIAVALKLISYFLETSKKVASYINDPSKEAKTGRMELVRKQIQSFIEQTLPKNSKLVIFVDDLERCHPPSAIDLLEINNQVLCFPNVVTVIMADVPLLAAQAEIKYKVLADRYPQGDFGRMYLQKIIQLQFDIPIQTSENINKMVESAILKEESTSDDPKRESNQPSVTIKEFFKDLLEDRYMYPGKIISSGNGIALPALLTLCSLFFMVARPVFWLVNRAVYYKWKYQAVFLTRTNHFNFIEVFVLLMLFTFSLSVYYNLFLIVVRSGQNIIVPAATLTFLVMGLVTLKVYRYSQYSSILNMARNQNTTKPIPELSSNFVKEEKVMQELAEDSDIFRNTREFAQKYLHQQNLLLPRNAKRITNKIRLAIFILHKKGVLNQYDPKLARYLAKWVVFQEKWPGLYLYLMSNTPQAEMRNMEIELQNSDPLLNKEYISKACAFYSNNTNQIKSFLLDDEVLLSEKITLLCYHEVVFS